MIIGVTGFARSGKDTIGQYLVERWDFRRVAFADAVREAVYTLNPDVYSEAEDTWETVQYIVDTIGWDRAKTEFGEIRRLLQVMGTEVGRMMLGPNVWVHIVDKKMMKLGVDDYVITDVRFENEADFVRDLGGIVVRVTRSGVEAINQHSSEVIDFDWDFEIQNDGTLDELYAQIDNLLT